MNNEKGAQDQASPRTTPYDMIGGDAGVRRLVDRFYDIMDTDPAVSGIRAMHAADLGPMRRSLSDFLSGWLGGPRLYNKCVMSAHGRLSIGENERDQWLACMRQALADTGASQSVQQLLERPLFSTADFMRKR